MKKPKFYYKVIVELGHLGCGNSTTTSIFIHTTSAYNAMKKAQKIPAVKHSKMPLKVETITEEEYLQGIQSNEYYNTINTL